MDPWIRFVGPTRALEVFGVKLVGLNAENGKKLLLSIALLLLVLAVSRALHWVAARDPAMWVRSRQYTGRIVTVTNDKVFEEPVYNFTRDFPYIWEEVSVPVGYKADRARAERILLDAAKRQTVKIAELSDEDARELERRYVVKRSGLEPKVYWRLTDNWARAFRPLHHHDARHSRLKRTR